MTRRAARSSGRGRCATTPVALVAACLALALAAAATLADTRSAAPRSRSARPRPAPLTAAMEARIARLASEVAERSLRLRLDEPDVPGTGIRDAHIIPVTQAVLDSDRTFRAEAARRLMAMAAADSGLSSARRADFSILRARLERLRLDRDELRRFETDPSRTWPRVDGTIRPLLAGRLGALCRRLAPATRRLRAVPEALRAVQVVLDRPSRLATETAIAAFGRTLVLCRRDIPVALKDCREPTSVAELAEADTLAARALQEFVTWLGGDVLPRASGTWAMGAETYARWLSATTGDTITPETNHPSEMVINNSIVALRLRAERELPSTEIVDSPAEARRADASRAAVADSLLASRVARSGRGTPRWPRTVFGRRELAFAWAGYARQLHDAARAGPAAEAPQFAPSRLDLVGLLVEIDLHTRGASIDDARSRLMRDAGLDSATAETEARIAALAPVRAAAAVTAWQLESVRVEAAQRLGARFSPRAFLAAVIDEGAVPVAAIREPVLRRLRVWGPSRRGP